MLEPLLASVAAVSTAGWILSAARRHPTPAACGSGINPPTAWRTPSHTIRVGTYNIHRGKGMDGRRDLRRIARHLESADVVSVQEATRPWRPSAPSQVEELGRMLDTGWLFLPGQHRWGRPSYGNGLLSRFPVLEWYLEPLVDTTREKFRTLTVAAVPLAGATCAVLVTHLSKRQDQQSHLRRALEEFRRHEVAVLAGDFNATAAHPLLRELVDSGDGHDAIATVLGVQDLTVRIDWILTRGLTVTGGGCEGKGASDHPYHWVDVQVAKAAGPPGNGAHAQPLHRRDVVMP